jgi:CRP/FNR family transcriptional regulator, cyclic AMP receptor protein
MLEESASGLFARHVSEIASVLEADPELAEDVPAEHREAAVRASQARVVRVARGAWNARGQAEAVRGGYGLLVLSGLLVRRVGITDHVGAELLGPGDLLRPLEHDGELATLPFAAAWRALEMLRLAVLDRAWSVRMSRFPDVGITLTARAMLRSRRLANTLVIASHPRLEERLLLMLWELADRYGTVHRDGVHLPLPLTHEVLAELTGARRPSVSAAVGRLARAGRLAREDRVWILRGEPPLPGDGWARA